MLSVPQSEFDNKRIRGVDLPPNPSGIEPVEYKCLVKPYAIQETDDAMKRAREAGIIIADPESNREQYAQVIALLIDVGGNAFEDWKGKSPVPGDRIMMAKYAGIDTLGADGRAYKIINDKDISAVLFEPEGDDPFPADEENGD